MKCESIREDLSAYHDGELSDRAAAVVEQHLSGCQGCREELGRIAKVWDLLGTLPVVQPSKDFKARFWEKVRREEERQGLWDWISFPSWRPVLAGFAAVWILGVTSGVLVYRHQTGEATASSMGAARVFTTPFPPNSIEQIYMQGPSNGHSGRS